MLAAGVDTEGVCVCIDVISLGTFLGIVKLVPTSRHAIWTLFFNSLDSIALLPLTPPNMSL